MKKVHVVPAFEFTYRVFNRFTVEWFGDFDSLDKAVEWCAGRKAEHWNFQSYLQLFSDGHLSKVVIADIIESPIFWRKPAPGRYTIIEVESGRGVTRDELEGVRHRLTYRQRHYRWKDGHNHAEDIVHTKKNIAKIKCAWSSEYSPPWESRWGSGEGEYHYGKYMGYNSRPIRTHREIVQVCAIENEYRNEYRLVRGRRREIPDSYDDINASSWHSRKSWKHNSKRRKQWIPKD